MTRPFRTSALAILLALSFATPAMSQSPGPSAEPSGVWPSGNDLRRDLQDIGFVFRIDRESGDWLGWAPRATAIDSPALELDGAGNLPAATRFSFNLLETDLLGSDADSSLTALMEVGTRLQISHPDIDRLRRFAIADLLTEAPEVLEPCYVTDTPTGTILVTVDREGGVALIELARHAVALASEVDPETCAPIAPSIDGPPPGEPSSERIAISIGGDQPRFDPLEVTLEGDLVTLVLTFQNDTAVEQSLTFDAPLESDTGLVAPGDRKLIVVRQLEPGEYPFYSRADPSGLRGSIRIMARQPT